MGRKKGATCTQMKEKPLKKYVVGYLVNEKVFTEEVRCTEMAVDGDDLMMIDHIKGLDEQIGGFKNWVFFREIHEEDEKPTLKLPADEVNLGGKTLWGKVDGIKF